MKAFTIFLFLLSTLPAINFGQSLVDNTGTLNPADSVTSDGWHITGNSSIDTASNFIGTTTSVDFKVKANNAEIGRFRSNGTVQLITGSIASFPGLGLVSSWFSGGDATTTKPILLLEPAGTSSTTWSTSGTGIGVNAASGFAGNLLDIKLNNSSRVKMPASGNSLEVTGTSLFSSSINMSAGTLSADAISSNGTYTGGNVGLILMQGTTANSQNIFSVTRSFTATGATNQTAFNYSSSFATSSGTATIIGLNIAPTVNQTGATGITRGVYINPTLTAAADWRSLEVTRGRSIFSGRLSTGKGANVASAASTTLGDDGNVFTITGTTNIDNINTTSWQAGSVVMLIFSDVLTVGDGSGNLKLAGNFVTSADDTLTIVFDGTNWVEIMRSTN